MTHDELMEKHKLILSSARYMAVNDGWFPLIDQLCTDLQALTQQGHPQTEAVQVKEKFGGLRFYVRESSEEQLKLIDRAEEESYKICDVCSKTGRAH